MANEYQLYNFDRPDKFSLEHMRSFETIFSMFSRNFSTLLSASLRLPVEMEVDEITQIPFQSEYIDKRARDEFALAVVEFTEEQFLMQFDVPFVLAIQSKLLGGDFDTESVPPKKDLTDFEQITVQMIMEEFVLPNLNDAFEDIEENSGFSLKETVTDPQYVKITLPQDMVALINMEIRIEESVSNIQFVMPFLSVESIIEKFNADTIFRTREVETSKEQLAHLYTHINSIEKDFVVNLGETTITLNDYEKLERGDVIPLNYVTEGVECTIGDKKKFEAKIGIKDNRYAVKITNAMKWRDGEEERESKVAKLENHIKHFKKR